VRVTVAAWLGAGNLGDELLFLALRRELARVGLRPIALSLDPAETRELHGVSALPHTAFVGAVRRTQGLVFGGGGLVQDQTSLLSPIYQLSRPLAARLSSRPSVAVGLGAGPLDSVLGRSAARAGLAASLDVVARDRPSVEVLRQAGVDARLGADLVFLLDPPEPDLLDEIVVSLRPRFPRGGLVPGRLRRHQPDQHEFAAVVAGQLDALVSATGLEVVFVSMEPLRDDPLHRQIADRMHHPVRWRRPAPSGVLGAIGSARVVIASRFHAGVAAVLGRRPVVLLGYAPKVQALAADVGVGLRLLDHDTAAVGTLARTAAGLLSSAEGIGEEPIGALRQRALTNREAVERFAEAVATSPSR
jgi:polysaccharide pyruvyl transferase CsaB